MRAEAPAPASTASVAPPRAVAAESNPIVAALEGGRREYVARWAALPRVALAEDRAIGPGDSAEDVAALRLRLGLPADGAWSPELANALSAFKQAHGLTPSSDADRATVAALNRGAESWLATIDANIARARAIPVGAADRYVLVDAASATLRAYEGGKVRFSSRVIAGRPEHPTPLMADQVRYLEFNPRWNLPPDAAREVVVPAVLRHGPEWVERNGFEVMADWSAAPAALEPSLVNWPAAARGEIDLRVRQKPGPRNAMGTVKFMFPNRAGIYLHDTNNRRLYEAPNRHLSYGCVRVEKVEELIAFLDAERVSGAGAASPVRVDLAEPVPVYLGYFTFWAGPEGLRFHEDVYGRDRAIAAAPPRMKRSI